MLFLPIHVNDHQHFEGDSVPKPPQPPFGGKSTDELAREQGAKPFDPMAFAGIVPPGEDIGEFVEEIYHARTSRA
jgi:hypothetical protein